MADLETRLRDELREQQRAVSAVLRAVASGEGLQPVLDEVLEAAARLCEGENGRLWLFTDGLLHVVANYGSTVGYDYDQQPRVPDRTTMAGRAAVTRDVVHLPDVDADPEYTYAGPRPYRSGLHVPILFEGDLIGVIGITREKLGPFPDEHVELVRTFADQAAVAIKNARLLETVERQLRQQRAVGAVMRSVARSQGLQPVLDDIVQSATLLSGVENGRLFLLRDGLLYAVANCGSEENFEYDQEHPHALDRSTLTGRAASMRQTIHIPDVLEDREYTYAGDGSQLPYRSGITVPIMLEEELIGALGIVSDQPRAFSDEHIELLETFADQAAIAIANARLIDAIEQQLDEQRAVSDTLRVVAEGGGLQPVLDAIVGAAKRLCAGEHAQLYLVEGDLLQIVSQSSDLHEAYNYARERPHPRDRSTVVGRVALSGEAEQIHDVLEDPDYTYGGQEIVGYRALLGVPIAKEDTLIGAIAVGRDSAGAFADDLVELVKTFADEAAVAITNARLIDKVERQLEQQRAVGDILRAVARSEGLEAVFNVVADSATQLCQGDYGAVYLKEGDALVLAAQRYRQAEVYEYEREHPHPIDRHTAIGRAAVTGDIVHIPDTQQDAEYSWGASGIFEYRSLLAAPILVDGELIGAMNVVKVAPEPFAPEHVELIRTFADQAAIAIANARLIDAVEQQLQQQQAISDVLGAVARAEGLESVLHELVEAACRLCGAQFGEVHLAEGDFLRLAAGHGGPPELYEFEREHPHPIAGDRTSVNGRVLLSRDVVHIPDILEDEEYAWSAADDAGIRALLGAPLLVEDQLVGVFNIVRTEPEPFADGEIELLRTFADQGAIAVANARLMEAVERQLEQQRAIGDVFGVVARSERLELVFEAAVGAATRLCQGEYGGLYLLEDGAFHVRAHYGAAKKQFEYEREHPNAMDRTTLVGRAGLTRGVVHIPNLAEDPDYDWPLLVGHTAGLAVPIFVEDELIGAISVTRTPDPFTEEQIELVKTFADQAAIAIANARLLDAVERQRSELARFVSPQVAELVSSDEGEKMLAGHRAYVTSMFCDLRGFTSFTELAEPEELFEVLREYHLALGELIPRYEGTLEHFAGDGLMVFFNDPVPVEEHELKAVQLALDAQARFEELASTWLKRGHELGLGVGIAAGYATLGRIGFEGRYDYGVLGTVTNLASRLSTQAGPGQTLISQRVLAAVEDRVEAEEIGALELKGFGRPVPAYEVRRLKT